MRPNPIKTLAALAAVGIATLASHSGLLGQSMPKLPHMENCDPQGYFHFYPDKLPTGSCFGSLRDSFLLDPLESVLVTRTWTDPLLGLDHVRYQQHYDGVPVEGAEFIEHSKGGFVVMANGKLVHDLPTSTAAVITEEEALGKLLTYLEGVYFPAAPDYAWLHPDWEAEIKLDTGDSTATYYPQGTLIWSLDRFTDLGFLIPGSRYRLGWRFEVLALGPVRLHKNYFVDAHMGAIYREDEIGCSNGPADILTQGSRIIDTQPDLFDHQLRANDLGRDIRTKYYDSPISLWGSLPNIKDNDDNWGTDHQLATTAHWMVTQAWDFFKAVYGLEGMDGDGSQVRVYAEYPENNTYYDRRADDKDYLLLGSVVGNNAVLDVIGHEYTHGVTFHSSGLMYLDEPGALNESFSDIFGTVMERHVQGGVFNWTFGEASALPTFYKRSLANPYAQGFHYPVETDCDLDALGQPKEYEGDYWYPPYAPYMCDYGGVHVNSGVQNHWFYLLSEGGAVTPRAVTGIGIEKAAMIAYYSLTNVLTSSSQYADARSASIGVARFFHGICSNEEIQLTNAWAAVGVGAPSTCVTIDTDQELGIVGTVDAFPNPTTGVVTVRCFGAVPDAISVFDVTGRFVFATEGTLTAQTLIDLTGQTSGMYIFEVMRKGQSQYLKVILQ